MSIVSKSSVGTDPTIAEPPRLSRDVEAGEPGKVEVSGKEAVQDAPTPRDEDGVAIIKGVPLVGLKGPDDPLSPLNLSLARRWTYVLIVSSCGFCVTSCSSMISQTYPAVEREFNVSREVITLGLSLFVLSLGLFPLIVAPLSQWYGRSIIYYVGFSCFICFQAGVAASQNAATLIICRFFAGAGGAAFLSVAGGTVADLFRSAEIAFPMTIFSASTFLGPVFGPVISGFINQNTNWRVTWYVLLGWACAQLAALLLFVRETLLPVVLKQRAKALRKAGRTDVRAPIELDNRSIASVLAVSCTQPFELLVLEPMVLALCTLTGLLLAILYCFFGSYGIVYSDAYGFDTQTIGLTFLPIGVGVVIGVATQPYWSRKYARRTQELGRRPPPEEQLRKGLWGAVLCPVSLFWFAWTVRPSVHWIVPMIATVPFGTGMLFVFGSVFAYLTDAFRPAAASSMAANSALRSVLAAAFPLFTTQMFHKLGNAWALTLCAFLCLALAPFPFIFFMYGHRLRKGSKFANQED
ncbi:hypothetical protein JCM10212_001494 [Sporobolomyces blumeae]